MKSMLSMKRTRTRPASNTRSKAGIIKSALAEVPKGDNNPGNSQNLYDKYTALAREALTTGDRVLAESYYQQAEHHLRVIKHYKENLQSLGAPKAALPAPGAIVKNNDFESSIDKELALAQANFS